MNPKFQRRDAWNVRRKSLFIESLILGLPIPQLVLAEKRDQRSRFIVLDGKQRLLSVLQFTGNAVGRHNDFRLSGLNARTELNRKRFSQFEADIGLQDDLNALLNHTIRTVIIRNWPSTSFLHLVFLRLNTGSVRLSPQELRQALFPGQFSDYIDDTAASSDVVQILLSRSSEDPDPRMRDVELLVRFLAFKNFINIYPGRMKEFLDLTCERLNSNWNTMEDTVGGQVDEFQNATRSLTDIFGVESVARKQDSRSFNRAIFDALVFYASDPTIRDAMLARSPEVRQAYELVLENNRFAQAVESDTAGIPNTQARLEIWGIELRKVTGLDFNVPILENSRIRFDALRN